jgi:hypothetical protein
MVHQVKIMWNQSKVVDHFNSNANSDSVFRSFNASNTTSVVFTSHVFHSNCKDKFS